jgi:hypothetical protein
VKKLLLLAVIVCVLYFIFHQPDKASSVNSPASESETSNSYTPPTSGDFGSGHQAGYDWAESNDITDESDCEAAGGHSNSPSFAEGCKHI